MSIKRSKRYKENKENISKIKTASINDAIKAFKGNKTVKFDETLDISVMLNKEKNKGEGLSRGFAQLPNGTGKKIKVAVFAIGEKAKEAKEAGADIVGNEDLIKEIKDGKINFDVAVSTPEMMKNIAVIGEKLGPLGIMPNPKTGTVTDNITKTIKNIKGGQIQFRSEKNAIVQAGIGKISFTEENLISNFKEFIVAVNKSKPDTIKGKFINKVYLSTSMGPSIKIENIK
ncbi:MAG: 50S ribosomal protein L1 [Alphaproteobacteria bacterium MarineAlpha6_Bin4]|nr:MAG: 50S ribosomal protein L1 [Alphaproteobacteria bacterium MarineAlpha6_Bin3]PPR38284.1 MAG: 50S ribosomal protein L1 [Alphaproteobacteria bacterium MarineAlpha6_Bin4]|tara:strand:+ start:1872 stop:2561 length:690 start_codon:yes stop_codon:yes gene_type:complete